MTDLPVRWGLGEGGLGWGDFKKWEGILVMGGCYEMGEFIPFMDYPPFRSGQKFYWEENFLTYM